jgi:methyl-accepting chemotaxis protein
VGVCGTGMELAFIQTLLQGIKLPKGGTAAVISTNGTIVATTSDVGKENGEVLGKPLADIAGNAYGSALNDLLDAVKNGKPLQYTAQGMMFFNEPFQVGEAPEKWSINIGIPVSQLMSPVYTMLRLALVITGIILIVMIAAILLIARSISAPVQKAVITLKEIFADGGCDLTRTVDDTSTDEIGELGRYINQTLSVIRKMTLTVKNQAGGLSELGSDLSGNMQETTSAINNIVTAIQDIKDKVVNQSASVDESAATMRQMTENIQKLGGVVTNQTEQVSRSSAAIEEMIANIASVASTLDKNMEGVKELSDAAGVGRQTLSEVTEDIREIAKQSAGMLEINAVIENIASQTNLLSMNAAIEAAHAGEAGKGFAVVADEIRKLAEDSGEQSKTIGSVLKKITESIAKINKSTDNMLSKFDVIEGHVKNVAEQMDGIRSAMDEQNEGGKQVLSSISSLNDLTQNVKNGSSGMLEGSQQVLMESQNLATITSEITNSMNEMAENANQINSSVSYVNELSEKNKNSIDIVAGEVSKFKVE